MRTRPQETFHGVVTAIDERNDRITLRLAKDASSDFRVQDALMFDAVRYGDQVEITVEDIEAAKTIVGLKKARDQKREMRGDKANEAQTTMRNGLWTAASILAGLFATGANPQQADWNIFTEPLLLTPRISTGRRVRENATKQDF